MIGALPARTSRKLAQSDFDSFAAISGDNNPIHVDEAFSKRTRFGATVAHGMLLYSVVWSMLRSKRLRLGRQISQTLKFPNPTYAGEVIDVVADAVGGDRDRMILNIAITRRSDGAIVCVGTAEFERMGH